MLSGVCSAWKPAFRSATVALFVSASVSAQVRDTSTTKYLGPYEAIEGVVDSAYALYLSEGQKIFSAQVRHPCNDIPFDSLSPADTLFKPLSKTEFITEEVDYIGAPATVFRNSRVHRYFVTFPAEFEYHNKPVWALETENGFSLFDLELDSLGGFAESVKLLNTRIQLDNSRRYTRSEILDMLEELFAIRRDYQILTQWLDLFVDGGKPHEDLKVNESRKRWAHSQLDRVRYYFTIPILREIDRPRIWMDKWPYRFKLYVWTNGCHVYRVAGTFGDNGCELTDVTDFGRCYCEMH